MIFFCYRRLKICGVLFCSVQYLWHILSLPPLLLLVLTDNKATAKTAHAVATGMWMYRLYRIHQTFFQTSKKQSEVFLFVSERLYASFLLCVSYGGILYRCIGFTASGRTQTEKLRFVEELRQWQLTAMISVYCIGTVIIFPLCVNPLPSWHYERELAYKPFTTAIQRIHEYVHRHTHVGSKFVNFPTFHATIFASTWILQQSSMLETYEQAQAFLMSSSSWCMVLMIAMMILAFTHIILFQCGTMYHWMHHARMALFEERNSPPAHFYALVRVFTAHDVTMICSYLQHQIRYLAAVLYMGLSAVAISFYFEWIPLQIISVTLTLHFVIVVWILKYELCVVDS